MDFTNAITGRFAQKGLPGGLKKPNIKKTVALNQKSHSR